MKPARIAGIRITSESYTQQFNLFNRGTDTSQLQGRLSILVRRKLLGM
jgi:hypothetical protein